MLKTQYSGSALRVIPRPKVSSEVFGFFYPYKTIEKLGEVRKEFISITDGYIFLGNDDYYFTRFDDNFTDFLQPLPPKYIKKIKSHTLRQNYEYYIKEEKLEEGDISGVLLASPIKKNKFEMNFEQSLFLRLKVVPDSQRILECEFYVFDSVRKENLQLGEQQLDYNRSLFYTVRRFDADGSFGNKKLYNEFDVFSNPYIAETYNRLESIQYFYIEMGYTTRIVEDAQSAIQNINNNSNFKISLRNSNGDSYYYIPKVYDTNFAVNRVNNIRSTAAITLELTNRTPLLLNPLNHEVKNG